MDTLHKIAGVTEATDKNEPPSHPAGDAASLQPDPNASSTSLATPRASRASIPINRQRSHKSFRSGHSGATSRRTSPHAHSTSEAPPPLPSSNSYHAAHPSQSTGVSSHHTGTNAGDEEEEDFTWGPTHPCFPHPNPHCARDSAEAHTTRVIRVRRDWLQSGDLYPQYANLYPEILDPLVTEAEFRFLVTNLNARLKAAFNPFAPRAWVDAALGLATGFLWDDAGLAGSKRAVKDMEAFVEGWNRERVAEGRDVRMIQVRRTGFLSLDFVVPDPGIDGLGEGEGESEMEGGIGPAE